MLIHELQCRQILQTVTRRERHARSFPPGLSMTQLPLPLDGRVGPSFLTDKVRYNALNCNQFQGTGPNTFIAALVHISWIGGMTNAF
jgi:hypothetical protein